jgi:hypothetical protein
VIVSASALVRNCGAVRKFNREKPRTEAMITSMARGTEFHKAVELWLSGGGLPRSEDLEIQGWLDLLVWEMEPRAGMEVEVAWGLSVEGRYLEVLEPEPHVYVAADPHDNLLTAGRADLVWRTGDHSVRVLDWKTGRTKATEAKDNLQVHAGGIAMAGRFLASTYQPVVYYARDGYWDYGPIVDIGGQEHARMMAEIRAAALLDETPRPGEWCRKCWDRKDCPPGSQYIQTHKETQ